MFKSLLTSLILSAHLTETTQASETVTLSTGDLTKPTGTERGNWHYQSATLADPGFIRTGALAPSASIASVSFLRYQDLKDSDNTAGSIHLIILTDPASLNSKIAESQNGVNVKNTTAKSIMTWKFDKVTISSTKEYYYAFYRDDNNNGTIEPGETPAIARISNLSGGSRLAGHLRSSPWGNIRSQDDAYISISAVSSGATPPGALLGLGNLSLILQPKN